MAGSSSEKVKGVASTGRACMDADLPAMDSIIIPEGREEQRRYQQVSSIVQQDLSDLTAGFGWVATVNWSELN